MTSKVLQPNLLFYSCFGLPAFFLSSEPPNRAQSCATGTIDIVYCVNGSAREGGFSVSQMQLMIDELPPNVAPKVRQPLAVKTKGR